MKHPITLWQGRSNFQIGRDADGNWRATVKLRPTIEERWMAKHWAPGLRFADPATARRDDFTSEAEAKAWAERQAMGEEG